MSKKDLFVQVVKETELSEYFKEIELSNVIY